jgi:hypothetical protein
MSKDARGSIVCIGWGSLVYEPRELPCGRWHDDGPSLPVEFVRESGNRRITLVIHPEAPRVPPFWSALDVPDLVTARDKLGVREYKDAGSKWIAKYMGQAARAWRRGVDQPAAEVRRRGRRGSER